MVKIWGVTRMDSDCERGNKIDQFFKSLALDSIVYCKFIPWNDIIRIKNLEGIYLF